MKALKITFWALLFLGVLTASVFFAMQNNDLMTVQIFDYTTEAEPKWKILLFAMILGFVLSAGFFMLELIILETRNIRLKRQNRQLEKTLKEKEDSLPKESSSELVISDVETK